MAEGVSQQGAGAVKDFVAVFGLVRLRAETQHDVGAVGVALKKLGSPEDELAGLPGGVTPVATKGVLITGWITELDAAAGADVVGQPDPHGWLGVGMSLGIRMQSDEIHAQLGQLRDNRFVVVGVPPVGTFGEIVEGLNAAKVEERLGVLIEFGQLERDSAVRNHVAVQIEANAEVLGEAIGGIERAHLVATEDEDHLAAVPLDGLEQITLLAKDGQGGS